MADQPFEPDWFSKPSDTLLAMMANSELSLESLAAKTRADVRTLRGLISGSVPIDKKVAEVLSISVGGTPKFWLARQAAYERALLRASQKVSPEKAKAWL